MTAPSTEPRPASPSPSPAPPSKTPPSETAPPATPTLGLRVGPGTRSRKSLTPAPAVDFSAGSEASGPRESPSIAPDPISDSPRPTATLSGSEADQVKVTLGIELLRGLFRDAVQTVGEIFHMWLTTSQLERDVDLYMAEEIDKKSIGDPLAEIARRRLGDNFASADIADLIKAGIGFANYAQKSVHRKIEIIRAVRKARLQQQAAQS